MEKVIDYLLSKNVVLTIALVIGMIVVLKLYKKVARTYLNSDHSINETIERTLFDAIRFVIILLFVMTILQINGINISSLIASLSVASMIIGLALQDFLKDIIMGVHILIDKFYQVGDVIQYGDEEGVVISFNLRTTRIESIKDHDIMTISNRNISDIIKVSTLNDIDLGLSYEEDFREVTTVLKEVVRRLEAVDGIDSAVFKGTNAFNDSTIIYKVRFFCEPSIRYDMRRAANYVIQEVFDEYGIKFPYGQLDVHIKSH
ncbi:MAG: mechanosensitive ion channel family protein [Erysipelotrichaceae bacterium]|nr:mechanosensitive ion channel family protein [Erysipelotrichaceae bacterium]